MTDHVCMRCGAALHGDEIALFRKMVCREAAQFLCLDCLAADIPTTRERLEARIQWFYRTGVCTLFVRSEEANDEMMRMEERGAAKKELEDARKEVEKTTEKPVEAKQNMFRAI